MMQNRFFSVIVAFFCLALASCERENAKDISPLAGQEIEYLLVIDIDMSGSYADFMTKDGKAYKFILKAIDRFFRQRIGSQDRLVIGQLSANRRALLFDGSPRALRQQFPSAEKFRSFLMEKSNPNGSPLWDGISDSLEYVLDFPGVRQGKCKTAVLCLTDMENNLVVGSEKTAEDRIKRLLAEYAQTGGCVGMFWVKQEFVPMWRGNLSAAGLKSYVVEADIVADPALPSFD